MTPNPITATPDDHLTEIVARMRAGGFRRLPVIADGAIVGIITDHDVREHVAYLRETKVSGAMTSPATTIDADAPVVDAARTMLRSKIGGLPVVEGGRLVGIVTASDCLRALLGYEERASQA
jgi:acetoin utilization protein AcuB